MGMETDMDTHGVLTILLLVFILFTGILIFIFFIFTAPSYTFQPTFFGGFSSIPRVVTSVIDSVDVAQEDTAEFAAPVVTIQHNIDALPIPPQSLTSNSKFRNPIPPPIPAGIVQATQPTFEQVAIRV